MTHEDKGRLEVEDRGAVLIVRVDGGPHGLFGLDIPNQLEEHGPYGPGHDGWWHDVPRDDGWLFGNDAVDECGIVQSVNTVMGDFLADAEALLAARLERVSLDDIARQAQPIPLHPKHGAHHHG